MAPLARPRARRDRPIGARDRARIPAAHGQINDVASPCLQRASNRSLEAGQRGAAFIKQRQRPLLDRPPVSRSQRFAEARAEPIEATADHDRARDDADAMVNRFAV